MNDLYLSELRDISLHLERLNAGLQSLRAEVLANRVTQKTGREIRAERRHRLIREVAETVRQPSIKATATATFLVIIGTNQPPTGFESLVKQLQNQYRGEGPPCIRTIERVLERTRDTNDI